MSGWSVTIWQRRSDLRGRHGYRDNAPHPPPARRGLHIGGYLVVVPRSAVQPFEMSAEDAMRFILTAGIAGNRGAGPAGPATSSR